MLTFSVVMLIVFVIIEHKAKEPIIPLLMFKNSIFVCSIIAAFLSSALMFSAVMFIPLFVQGVMEASATSSGVVTMPMMLSQVIADIITGQIISKIGKYKLLAILSFVISTVGVFLLAQLNINSTNLQVAIGMVVIGVGIGITMPVFSLSVQNAFSREQIGVVTSGLQFFRNIGGTIGAAVLGTIMTTSMGNGILHATSKDILKEDNPADIKLLHLLEEFAEAKRHSAIEDPEMFANYIKLAQNSMEVLEKSIEEGINGIEEIIAQGIKEGVFFSEATHQAARTVYLATSVFMYPNSFGDTNRKQNIDAVINLLIRGLKNPNK